MSKQQPDDAMLAGKMVLVTGASRGIGRAIALACAAAGADVAVTYRTSRSAADDVAGTIRGLGRRAEVFATDASQADDVRRLAADARGALGRGDGRGVQLQQGARPLGRAAHPGQRAGTGLGRDGLRQQPRPGHEAAHHRHDPAGALGHPRRHRLRGGVPRLGRRGVCDRTDVADQRRGRDLALKERGMAAKEPTYTHAQGEEKLKDYPRWWVGDGWIRRNYKTDGWPTTLMLVNTIGYVAEAAYHHPDLAVTWGRVIVKLKNHAAGGITDKDFELARKIEDTVLWRPKGGALEGTPNKFVRSGDPR